MEQKDNGFTHTKTIKMSTAVGCGIALLLFFGVIFLLIFGWWYFVKMGR